MSLGAYQVPRDAGTVPVHVQVIDLQPFSLDLVVPTYLPAKDLTQRVARDAGLGGYWPDGTRREYWLRARGRLMLPEEKLQDLGVVPYELLHLLPQPPPGSGLQERPPEYPPNRGYAAAGNLNVVTGLVAMFSWSLAWGLGMTVTQGVVEGLLPGVGLSLVCTSFSRYLWGGLGSQVRIPITAFLVFGPMLLFAGLPPLLSHVPIADLAVSLGSAFVGGAFGILLGWLAWYGAVEPLPKVVLQEVKQAEALVTWPCGICGGPVTVEVKADCVFGCGRVFHQGCYATKNALSDGQSCAVCGLRPAAVQQRPAAPLG